MRYLALIIATLFMSSTVQAAEGMWTFDNAPFNLIRDTTGAGVDQAWLDRVRAGAVRLTNGCSASVVSAEGLVATNHHCVVGCAQELSSPNVDYLKTAFLTASREDEKICPGIQAEVLVKITDVTGTITAAAAGKSGSAYVQARDRAMAAVEKELCGTEADTRCQTISLYGDGQFKVYRYHIYKDVRLVFAPELDISFFGGDPDNFNFPRFSLDAAFLRLYRDGRPAATPDHLRWNARAPKAGEAVFVVGNPGSTERGLTAAQLVSQRDLAIPMVQLHRAELRGRLLQFSRASDEQARLAAQDVFGVENSYKVYVGRMGALTQPDLLARKLAEEASLRKRVAADSALSARTGEPWAKLEAVQTDFLRLYPAYRQLEQGAGSRSRLYAHAVTLVRGARERAKPPESRLAAYADTRLPLIERGLGDAVPIDAGLEALHLEFWLLKTREALGPGVPEVRLLLGAESPEILAQRLSKSALDDPQVRMALWRGGLAAVQASTDPMIQFVLRTNAQAEAVRDEWWEKVSGPSATANAAIETAKFAINGAAGYPDATFSLRLSFGKVEGWSWRGETVKPLTTFAGLYDHATGAAPFALPDRWLKARDRLDAQTVLNFSSSNDVVGGNSGSPILDARGDVIGLIFDGNIHSLGGAYGYDREVNRTVSVTAAAVSEALLKVYGQARLASELARSVPASGT